MRKQNFRKFINDCYVDHSKDNFYDVVSSTDEELFVRVKRLDWNIYEIIENDFFEIDNDAKRELLFSKVDEFLESKEEPDTSDYEHPSVAGGLYGNTITGIYKYKN